MSQNYVVTLTPRKPFGSTDNLLDKSTCEVMQSVQYFDGLGRPLQTVQVKGSPDAEKDIVIPVAYDAFGREVKKYLPYASSSNNGSYKTNGLTDQERYYAAPPLGVTGIPNSFEETRFEPSPLNRVVEQGAPGAAWQMGGGHTVRTEYSTNNADVFNSGNTAGSRRVALYTASVGANNRTLSRENNTAVYAGSQLYVTITRDENWKDGDGCLGTSEEYKDKQGQVVLKRTYNKKGSTTEMLSTYYVYDDYGNLSFVLPPASNPDANAAISSTTLNNLCYQYRYDGRNRMTGKKVPGKGWELMIYNQLDQLVLSQDALQRAKSPQQWSFTKYDALGRVIMTGLYSDASGAADSGTPPGDTRRAALQTAVNAQTGNLWENRLATAPAAAETGYSNIAFPTTAVAMYLSINYYDDYAFPGGNPYPNTYSQMLKGLLTGSRIKVLKETTAGGTTDMLWNVNYYDDKGRVVHSYNQHYKGGSIAAANHDETLNTYSFADEVEVSTRLHHISGSSAVMKVVTQYEYDHMGRKKRTYQQIGDNEDDRVELASLRYNEVGQLKDKALHNNLQSTSYSYNPRGWLKASSSPQFGMTLKYEDGTSPQWNGNITAQEWNGGSYAYSYDKLNRLVSGIAADGRSEKSIGYDQNGNITALQRYTSSSAKEDGLRYAYSGNRLSWVYDSVGTYVNTQYQQPDTTKYGYDLNGNMTGRTNTARTQNNLSTTYNVLNLPKSVTLANGTVIQYVYDASGRKLRKLVGTAATEYISGIQYSGTVLDFIQTEEGRVLPNGSSYKYEYNLSDHLGNVRYSFDSYNGSVRKLQEDDYYPFGLRIARVAGTVANKYLYNGKEIQDELNQYDYGARFYDPVIGRWNVIDPMTEKYYGITPYAYSVNSPISIIDPDGRDIDIENLTDEDNKKALVEFLKTRNGQAFIASYLKKDQTLTIKTGSKTHVYTTKKDGEFSNDLLAIGSAENLGTAAGLNMTKKPDGNDLLENEYGEKDIYNVDGKVVQQIWMKRGADAMVLGHEAFVHAFSDQNRLRELRQQLNDGSIKPGSALYEKKLEAIVGSGPSDHKNLGDNRANVYRNYAHQLDVVNSTTRFIKSYNEDVKEHKK